MEAKRLTQEVQAEFCRKCSGMWFDHGEIKSALQGRITERSGRRDMLLSDEVEWECPDCHLPLLRRELILDTEIIVDQCRRCAGSFMEARSVERLRTLLRNLAALKQQPRTGP